MVMYDGGTEEAYLLRELHIMPTSEPVLFVPDTLTMTDEDQSESCFCCHPSLVKSPCSRRTAPVSCAALRSAALRRSFSPTRTSLSPP